MSRLFLFGKNGTMKHILRSMLPFAAAMLVAQSSFAQDKVMTIAEYMPSLEGCQTIKDRTQRGNCTKDKITAFLNDNLKLPKEMLDAGVQNTAVVEIIIDAEGKVAEMKVVDDPGYGMGDAAEKALKKLSKSWYPAEHFGEKVTAKLNIPVQFALPEGPEEEPESRIVVAEGEVFSVVETMPAYEGCSGSDAKTCTFQSLNKYCRENIKYPEAAKADGVEGMVMTRFVIDEEGNVTNVEVTKGLGHGCDEEAVRLMQSLPKWIPGKQAGTPVKVQMDIPVHFKLRSAD